MRPYQRAADGGVDMMAPYPKAGNSAGKRKKKSAPAKKEAAMPEPTDTSKVQMFSNAESGRLSEGARDLLRNTVARVEALTEERADVNDQIKAVFAEAKARGFDTKALRKVIALRKTDKDQREADQAVLDIYLDALGEL